MKYVKATKYGVEFFEKGLNKFELTEGEIYEFPDITFDCGRKLSLSPSPHSWYREFIFVDGPEQEITYEIY